MDQQKIYKADFLFDSPGEDKDWSFSLFFRTPLSQAELKKMFKDPFPGQFCSQFGDRDRPGYHTDILPCVYGIEDWWLDEDLCIYGIIMTKLKQSNEEEAGNAKIFDLTKESWQEAYDYAYKHYMM